MTNFQVKYWFESNSRDRSGEQVIETVQAAAVREVALTIEEKLARTSFCVEPSFGPAQEGGLVVIYSASVRYVEIIPAGRP